MASVCIVLLKSIVYRLYPRTSTEDNTRLVYGLIKSPWFAISCCLKSCILYRLPFAVMFNRYQVNMIPAIKSNIDLVIPVPGGVVLRAPLGCGRVNIPVIC